jgi:hypothetical protein
MAEAMLGTLLSLNLRDSPVSIGSGFAPSVDAAWCDITLQQNHNMSVLLPERSAFGGLSTLS